MVVSAHAHPDDTPEAGDGPPDRPGSPGSPGARSAGPAADRLGRREWGLLLVLCGAIFLEGLDVSMIGVALPSIRADLGMSTSSLQWVVSGYVLGYGGFLLLGGRAADLFGRRRMFLGWLAVFVLFSGLGGLATEGWVLVVARFATGVAAAFMTPAGMSIITTSFAEGPSRNRALLVYAGTAAGGFSLGLVVGGLLTEAGWRWVFFAPVVFSSVLLLAAVRLIPRSDRPDVRRSRGRGRGSVDLAGAVTVTAAMLLLVFTVVEAPDVGWGTPRTVGSLVATALVLGVFAVVEGRAASPLVRFGILRSGTLARASFGGMCLAGSFFGFQFIAVLYLQQVREWSALQTGIALLPLGIDAVLAPTITPRLVRRFGVTRVIVTGLGLAMVGYALFLPIGVASGYPAAMLPTFLLTGTAFALAYGPLTIAATNGIAPDEQGLAGGILNTSFQFGAALGLAIVTAVDVAATGTGGSPEALLDGYHAALAVPLATAGLGLVGVAAAAARSRRRPAPPVSADSTASPIPPSTPASASAAASAPASASAGPGPTPPATTPPPPANRPAA